MAKKSELERLREENANLKENYTNLYNRTHNAVVVPVKEDVLMNLLITAVESGSGYWARVIKERTEPFYEVTIEDCEADQPTKYSVTVGTMRLGLQRLAERTVTEKLKETWHLKPENAGRVLAAALTGEGDAGTADIVLQMGVFGEVLYG